MSEEIAWAVADIALQQRLLARARRWKRCASRLWARLRSVEAQRLRLEQQLAAHRALVERVDVFGSTVLEGELTPLQRMLWAEVRSALDAADASVGRAAAVEPVS